MASLNLFATKYAWECSACHCLFDAAWRPAEHPFKPPVHYEWSFDKPVFKYCPMCGEKFDTKETEKK